MGHTKEEQQKERLLNSLTSEWISMSAVCIKATLFYDRGKELLHLLESEGLVEFKVNDKFTYWRLKQ